MHYKRNDACMLITGQASALDISDRLYPASMRGTENSLLHSIPWLPTSACSMQSILTAAMLLLPVMTHSDLTHGVAWGAASYCAQGG